MPNKLTVLLADDHALVRRGFRRILEDEPTFQVVGEASDGLEAVQLAEQLHPNVIVMDCALPQITASKPPAASSPKIPTLPSSCSACIPKTRLSANLSKPAPELHSQKRYGPRPRRRHPENRRRQNRPRPPDHSNRQSQGRTRHRSHPARTRNPPAHSRGQIQQGIAAELSLSVNTVSVHRANIMDALGLHKTAELVVYAIKNGLVNLP